MSNPLVVARIEGRGCVEEPVEDDTESLGTSQQLHQGGKIVQHGIGMLPGSALDERPTPCEQVGLLPLPVRAAPAYVVPFCVEDVAPVGRPPEEINGLLVSSKGSRHGGDTEVPIGELEGAACGTLDLVARHVS